ncbi:MAG: hypothetical protein EXS08_05960 [Planctomycetes bacterium]|nr:hypothetical protein [Planctomycetota bacterium]
MGLDRKRAPLLAAGLLVLVLALSLPFTVHPWYDPTNDGSMYIATARALLAGQGYSYLGSPFLIRPPGFSCLIAPVLAARGTDFYALNLLVSACGALGVLLFHFFLRARLGLVLATLVPLVLWFDAGYQTLCNQVMSDVPGWAALVACLLLARFLERRPSVLRALALGATVGLATYLRSGNLLLAPAFLCAAFARELRCKTERIGWRATGLQGAALVLGTTLVFAPWMARNRVVAPPPPADQTLLYSYSSGMWHQDMGDPRSPRVPLSAVVGRFPERSNQILQTLGMRLREVPLEPWTRGLAVALVLFLLVALVRRRAAEEFFALGTLLVVAFYFGYAGRLLLPVFAFAVAAGVELVRELGARLASPRVGVALGALVCGAWIGLDWHPREGWQQIHDLHDAYAESARSVNAHVPPEAVLGAWRGWHHAVFLERPVYGFEMAVRREGVEPGCAQVIQRYGIDFVMLTPLGLPELVRRQAQEFSTYLTSRYGGKDRGLVRVR